MAAVIKIMYLMWAVLFMQAGSIMAPLITLRITADRATIITCEGYYAGNGPSGSGYYENVTPFSCVNATNPFCRD